MFLAICHLKAHIQARFHIADPVRLDDIAQEALRLALEVRRDLNDAGLYKAAQAQVAHVIAQQNLERRRGHYVLADDRSSRNDQADPHALDVRRRPRPLRAPDLPTNSLPAMTTSPGLIAVREILFAPPDPSAQYSTPDWFVEAQRCIESGEACSNSVLGGWAAFAKLFDCIFERTSFRDFLSQDCAVGRGPYYWNALTRWVAGNPGAIDEIKLALSTPYDWRPQKSTFAYVPLYRTSDADRSMGSEPRWLREFVNLVQAARLSRTNATVRKAHLDDDVQISFDTYQAVPRNLLDHAAQVLDALRVRMADYPNEAPIPEWLDVQLIAILIERYGFESGGGAGRKMSRVTMIRLLRNPTALANDLRKSLKTAITSDGRTEIKTLIKKLERAGRKSRSS